MKAEQALRCCGSDLAGDAGVGIQPPRPARTGYRVGTYATFREAMLARLSSVFIDVPASDARARSIASIR